MAKISALEKFFKTHRRSCAVHTYSGDRRCSCGRDEAWQEVLRLQSLSQPTKRAADGRDASQIDAAFVAGWEAYREAFDHYDDNGETVAHSLEWRKQEYLADTARR